MIQGELERSTLEQLEFDRVLEHIAGYASSTLGAEFILGLAPSDDVRSLVADIEMISEARGIIARQERPPLDGIYDIRRALSVSKISGSFLNGEDLRAVVATIAAMRTLHDFFEYRRDHASQLAFLTSGIHTNKLLERHISDAIDESGLVRDNASKQLRQIRRDIIDKSASLRAKLQRILRKVSDEELLTDDYVTLREGRLVLPVKTENKRKIPGIIHGESNTGGTVFLEPAEVFDMNNEIAELTFAERREVEKILRTLTQELGAEADLFQGSVSILEHLDSLIARAYYGERYGCSAPVIQSGTDTIRLIDARHPLLLLRLSTVVPCSVELNVDQRCIVISGPNAGGKTVAMKTVGLIAAMALSGIHTPTSACHVHPTRIYCDIGDQQSLENDLSTFSSHISRIGAIIEHSRRGDLVLLDEIGSGTDPDEGGAIAASVLEHLLSVGALIMATTHQSYLKIFAYNTPSVVNAGMEFNTDTITPTYRCHIGTPGNSYAFELIERLGFRKSILESAKEKLGQERNQMTDIIGDLQAELEQIRAARIEQEQASSIAKAAQEKLEIESRQLREQRQSMIADAQAKAKELLDNANGLIENTLREIRSGATNDDIKRMRSSVEKAKQEMKIANEEQEVSDGLKFHKGDAVRLKGNVKTGECDTDQDENGYVVVQLGSLRMRAHIDDLELVSTKEVRAVQRVGRTVVGNAELAEVRIDLRGLYAEEAVVKVEQAITAGLSANLTSLELIHGKGTGALRLRLHEHLKGHPGVEKFRLGTLTEGGAGVTIVDLK